MAAQIPLLHLCERHAAPHGLRVPQSGLMHEPRPGQVVNENHYGPLRNTYQRTHRWARVHRHEDELAVISPREDRVAHVLFSAAADDVGLYGKPMARNAQVWTRDFQLLLDGPRASRAELQRAAEALAEGGLFGYRFLFPAMRLGRHEVYWHRPMAAWLSAKTLQPEILGDGLLGYFTAYGAGDSGVRKPIELWPRLLHREPHRAAIHALAINHEHHAHQTTINVRKLFQAWDLLGRRPLDRGFARQLLTLPKHESLADWIPKTADGGPVPLPPVAPESDLPAPLTFHRTAPRGFEVAYWKTIARLAHGEFVNKDNADCARDPISQRSLRHHHRDLEALGDYLLAYYRRLLDRSGVRQARVGDIPFRWETDFDFTWSGGWLHNREEKTEERDILVVIPGRDRRRAVILADHYDTAYMEDRYEKAKGGDGARLAAAGADDNHSATAALMLAAPVFLELSRAGRLGCDIWLVHLTGEEFPADCMGARHLAQRLVERTLALRVCEGVENRGTPQNRPENPRPRKGPVPIFARRRLDLSPVSVQGVYVMDMIAHNNDHEQDVFQIAPGTTRESMELAYQAHLANAIWNAHVARWNRRPSRQGCDRGRRSPDGRSIPPTARHPELSGEIRPAIDPRSALYNTDGQIFSDAGVPVVLFMENYDINRVGYHDTHDTMANIDLDYGAAVAAIAIESAARAAGAV